MKEPPGQPLSIPEPTEFNRIGGWLIWDLVAQDIDWLQKFAAGLSLPDRARLERHLNRRGRSLKDEL